MWLQQNKNKKGWIHKETETSKAWYEYKYTLLRHILKNKGFLLKRDAINNIMIKKKSADNICI